VLLSIVKLLAYTVAAEVPGVAAMGTKGYIATTLNVGRNRSRAEYAAAASNYEPNPARDNGFFTGRFANWIIDKVFENAANDLVVPRDGVFAGNGHPSFPIENPLIFAPSEAVWHTDFFSHAATANKIVSFLRRRNDDLTRFRTPSRGYDLIKIGNPLLHKRSDPQTNSERILGQIKSDADIAIESFEAGADRVGADLSGASSLSQVGSSEFELACDEVDHRDEIARRTIAASSGFGSLNETINPFEQTVGDARSEPAKDAAPMAADRACGIDHGLDAAV
jgi:hypothetical protein